VDTGTLYSLLWIQELYIHCCGYRNFIFTAVDTGTLYSLHL